MDKPKIGIRQADGSFYEIMDDSHPGRKRLVLSAARTDQHGVRIDLYRTEDGTLDPSLCLGTIPLDDPEGLGYQDIEFLLELDDDGQLEASAALPGQAPRSLSVDLAPFQAARRDADILSDDSVDNAELDTLDPDFAEDDLEVMTLDLPEIEDLPEMEGLPDFESSPAPRSDADILSDESLADGLDDLSLEDLNLDFPVESETPVAPVGASAESPGTLGDGALDLDDDLVLDLPVAGQDDGAEELGSLDDFDPESLDTMTLPSEEGVDEALALEDPLSLDEPLTLDEPLSLDEPDLEDLDGFELPEAEEAPGAPAPASFDLADLESGFGDEPGSEPAVGGTEEWEKISLDDLEPMEFMDTGHEISAPKPRGGSTPEPPVSRGEFSMDDEAPLELGDLDSDMGDLPTLDDDGLSAPQARSEPQDLDQDFMDLEELSDDPAWTPEEPPKPATWQAKETKAPKPVKAPRSTADTDGPDVGGLDKTALFLSLSAISLLVLLILVLLFLNMVKAPQAPVIQPEVRLWKPAAALASPSEKPVGPVDLGASDPVTFEASTVLEVPAGLSAGRVTLALAPGDTAADATRRFGAPARSQGNLLSW